MASTSPFNNSNYYLYSSKQCFTDIHQSDRSGANKPLFFLLESGNNDVLPIMGCHISASLIIGRIVFVKSAPFCHYLRRQLRGWGGLRSSCPFSTLGSDCKGEISDPLVLGTYKLL
ncbi:hypothetical protein XELAEV_18024022mg [Xenopus laevis]|uniref:Uncharacterized protein n=1 Tax=Xenopus laevis TaxID=8355 RepID=A0A974D575_XENLA|nr:hypothetical protein XELAEV_18024022mg [Xenopus laevis]